jgi:hypothetical protein
MRTFVTCAMLTVALLTAGVTSAQAGWHHRYYGPAIVIRPAPLVVVPAAPVVVAQPAPVVIAQPTLVAPVYAPAPVVVGPVFRPIISLRLGIGR